MAPAAPHPPSGSRRRGVAKNLLLVVACLLVGGAAAFVVPPRDTPQDALPIPAVAAPKAETPTPPPPVKPLTGPYRDPRIPKRMPPGPELRRPTQDVWCEGLSVERCDDFPKDCELATYCDGVRFCRTQPRYPNEATCAEEGILGANVACCPGLVPRCGSLEHYVGPKCDPIEGTTAEPVCVRCGDGVCGRAEQVCNCPEDCAR
ncbi:hypothetical protein SAMN05443572_1068 [Myxococcus fulvus]|uniref:Uncharacterized protein n=1 Tax=Myxococcus fulvus TaxID=33 RepID=A0A511TH24_MYXFU|nr:hypothetical protein [Myxococcus fulvus]GEN13480.1 hypothetical protein MFU01_85170 [Myxococcus fulvus]SEU19396.1 hypothetical protein SAMN05443572_1068 [Myxococcus fulvus]